MSKVITVDGMPAALGPYSQAVEAGGFLFASGIVPVSVTTGEMPEGIVAQTNQVLKNAAALLKGAGYSPEDVVKTTCFLTDIDDFSLFNDCYASFFIGKPARSCMAVKDLPKGALVEVEFIAYK